MSTRTLTLTAVLTAMLCILGPVTLPLGAVPLSLTTALLMLMALLLGTKRALICCLLYLLLGLLGLPVFSGFRGGVGHLVGVTGGFLWGFLVSCLVYWVLEKIGKIPALVASLLACYLCGCGWFYFYSGGGLAFILARCVIPCLIPDTLKLWLAYSLSRRLRKVINIPSRT